jgi:hypothetical protein
MNNPSPRLKLKRPERRMKISPPNKNKFRFAPRAAGDR